MSNAITKEYYAFRASGYKTWGDNKAMVQIITNDGDNWSHLDFTVEEAHKAIELLNAAIVEAESAEDRDTSQWEGSPF